MIDMKK